MSLEQRKDTARRYIEQFWGDCDLDLAEELLEPDFVFHSPLRDLKGREAIKVFVSTIHTVFDRIGFGVEDLIAEGDKVAIHWRLTGEHVREFMGIPPSGKSIDLAGATIASFKGGKLNEAWLHWDRLTLLEQLKEE